MSGEAIAPSEPQKKRGFSLPSAYTILFALIVVAAIATWVIPAGVYDLNAAGEPIPASIAPVFIVTPRKPPMTRMNSAMSIAPNSEPEL